ncbi:MAG: hypothetical protein AABX27_00165 [Nanoarchaeota archaeon]
MLKKGILIAVILIVIFSGIAFAQEEQQVMPEGYRQIAGTAGTTIYNPADLAALFGVAPVESNGTIKVSFMGARGEIKSLGFLSGKIIRTGTKVLELSQTDENLQAGRARYISPIDSARQVKVRGVKFAMNATELAQGRIGFTFMQDTAFYPDENLKAENADDARTVVCRGMCRISAEIAPAGIYFDIGNGAVLFKNDAERYMRNEAKNPIQGIYAEIANLHDVILMPPELNDNPKIELTARPNADGFGSSFGSINLSSQGIVGLGRGMYMGQPADKPYDKLYFPGLMRQGLEANVYTDEAYISAGEGAAINIFAPSPAMPDAYVNLFRLEKGDLLLVPDKVGYDACAQFKDERLRHIGCVFANPIEMKAYINPRDTINRLAVENPASAGYTNIYLENFLQPQLAGTASEVIVEKADKKMLFGYDRVDIEPAGDWFDFGISFSTAPILYENQEAGEPQSMLPQNLNRFECILSERKCFLTNLATGLRDEVLSFTERKPVECRENAECGEGIECVDFRCTIPQTCEKLIDGGRIDVLFISEGYTNYDTFKQDVRKLLNDASFNGLFTISPFDEFSEKFTVWTMRGGRIRAGEFGKSRISPADPVRQYIAEYDRHCSNDITVLVSKSNIFNAYTWLNPSPVTVLSMVPLTLKGNANIFIHEFAHAFATLQDEYLEEGITSDLIPDEGLPNCVSEEIAQAKWGEFFTNLFRGCGGVCKTEKCDERLSLLRPSDNSIMRASPAVGADKTKFFNEISKKQLRGKAEGRPTTTIWGRL